MSHEKFGKLVQPGNICDIVALEYRHLTEPERVKNKTIIRSVYRTIDLLFDFVLLFLFIAVSLLFIGLCHFIKFSYGSSHTCNRGKDHCRSQVICVCHGIFNRFIMQFSFAFNLVIWGRSINLGSGHGNQLVFLSQGVFMLSQSKKQVLPGYSLIL